MFWMSGSLMPDNAVRGLQANHKTGSGIGRVFFTLDSKIDGHGEKWPCMAVAKRRDHVFAHFHESRRLYQLSPEASRVLE